MKNLKVILLTTLICALFASCSSKPTYEEGYHEGYEKGYSEGFQEGHDKGFEEASKLIPTPAPTQTSKASDEATELDDIFADSEEAPAVESEASEVTSSEETGATVYRGKTGNKYHRQDCRTLKGGGTAITLDEAISQGREACKICKP